MTLIKRKILVSLFFLLTLIVSNAQVNYVAWTVGITKGSFKYDPLLFHFEESAGNGSPLKPMYFQSDKYNFLNWKIAIEAIQPKFIMTVSSTNPFKTSAFVNNAYIFAKNHSYVDMRFAYGIPVKKLLSIYGGCQFNIFNNDVLANGFARGVYYSTGSIEGLNHTDKLSAISYGLSANLCVNISKKFFIRGSYLYNKFKNKERDQYGKNNQFEIFLYSNFKQKGKSNIGFNIGVVKQNYTIDAFNLDKVILSNSGTRAAPEIKMSQTALVVSLNIPIKFWD